MRCALALAVVTAGCGAARAADVNLSYVSDTASDLSGGLRRGTVMMGKADVTALLDRPFGIDGGSAYLDLEYVHGRSLSGTLVGDFQTVSNIDAFSALRPFEAWIRVPISGPDRDLTFGLIDLNSTFDVQRIGRLFLSSSFGIGPDFSQSGRNGPSIFPTTSPAVAMTAKVQGWSGRIGLFEAVAGDPQHPGRTVIRMPGKGGFLMVAEADRAFDKVEFQLGGWAYTGRFDRLAPTPGTASRATGNRGAYAQVEATLAGDPDATSLEGWLRGGVAATRFNPLGRYLGGGLAFGTDHSRAGLAFAHAWLGQEGQAALAPAHRAETAIELTYSNRARPWLRVQPDVQYVVHPSWRTDIGNALVTTLRLVVSAPVTRATRATRLRS